MDINMSTQFLNDKAGECSYIDELKAELFPLISSQQEQWKNKIREIISGCGCSQESFAKRTGFSRQSVSKWCQGALPRSRETFLIIGLAAGFDTDGVNRLLQRYGRYPALYSKTLEDCVCMYTIAHGNGSDRVLQYKTALERIRRSIFGENNPESSLEYFASLHGGADDSESTELFDDRLSRVEDETGLDRFIEENAGVFSSAYRRLYSYIKAHIAENYSSSVAEMAIAQGWSSSLKQAVSKIRQGKWEPTRNKIISLGLHLSMDQEQINEMLSLARMEPLCAKNIAESVIIFILEDASLNEMLDPEAEDYDADDLCKYAREVIEELDMPELNIFISELELPDDE